MIVNSYLIGINGDDAVVTCVEILPSKEMRKNVVNYTSKWKENYVIFMPFLY
jgi:hypothetical protein